MRLQNNTPAPLFETTDVFGVPFSLSAHNKGNKVFLVFMRFAGCPVCHFRVHQLVKNADRFKKKNIKVVLVYESSKSTMTEYLHGEKLPFTFITDPENKIYKLYAVETSFGKLISSIFKGMVNKAASGRKLFKKKIVDDGKVTRMNAEFLIDETGKLTKVHYAEFLGDDLAINDLFK